MAANPTCKYGYHMVRGRLSVTNTEHDNGWRQALFLLVKPEGEEELWCKQVNLELETRDVLSISCLLML